MNELPKYFVIKRDADNPLWQRYIDWLKYRYGSRWDGTLNDYYGFDGNMVYDSGVGCCSEIRLFPNNPTIITLEQWNEAVNGFPEKWCMEIKDREQFDAVSVWFGFANSWIGWANWRLSNLRYVLYNKTSDFNNLRYNLPEITFEQFKKYVLKKETMEKKIIGYKLEEGCEKYLPVLDKISSAFSVTRNYYIEVGCIYYDDFKEAQVLDLWFEPIYEGDTPDITINSYKAQFNGDTVRFGCKTYTKEFIFNLEDVLNRGVDLTNEKDKIIEIARYFRNKQTL